MRNWGSCQFEGETLDLEDLKLVLDMASPDRSFASKANGYPIDFRHENAFKFKNMYYKDARWVKMEDLYALKNCCDVVLGRTMFTQPEIKAFINHWVNREFISGEGDKFDKAIRNREGVIELLIEKKQLEMELESADEENKQYIPKRLNQLEDEIESYGVFFANGKATLRLPTL
ncbi:hypothetical protein CAEBREN_25304 [Caenorhabditis brenneri]|uniref:Uncharacterized protein n=1 Tax=Caenorhabditis brenneri TaxID=135651 RepID=G0PHW1_CAEBE|nr:hypothetical protein CAEBREN_25304 [Caenorhabditis brenneri]